MARRSARLRVPRGRGAGGRAVDVRRPGCSCPSDRRYLLSIAAPGDRALLLFPAGLEFLAGLLGCLYAAIIAIPAPSPEASRLKRTGPRLRSIAEDARASVVLTTSKIRALVEASDPPVFERGAIRWVETDQTVADPSGTCGASRGSTDRSCLSPVHVRLDLDAQGGHDLPPQLWGFSLPTCSGCAGMEPTPSR